MGPVGEDKPEIDQMKRIESIEMGNEENSTSGWGSNGER